MAERRRFVWLLVVVSIATAQGCAAIFGFDEGTPESSSGAGASSPGGGGAGPLTSSISTVSSSTAASSSGLTSAAMGSSGAGGQSAQASTGATSTTSSATGSGGEGTTTSAASATTTTGSGGSNSASSTAASVGSGGGGPSCSDKVKNGAETDVDCGGGTCPACPTGDACVVNGDCIGMVCVNKSCTASCLDGVKDNGETDIDCGGPACSPCAYGKKCVASTDCATSNCTGGLCACGGNHLVLSEIKTRGVNGGSDEFIEIYNPTPNPVVLDSSWHIQAQAYNGASYVLRWVGSGATLPPDMHYLTVGAGYAMAALPDDSTLGGIGDASSVTLTHGASTIDAVCFQYNAATLVALENPAIFTCEGTPASNLPHNDVSNAASNMDVSLERKPGGAAGNCMDTQDNSNDFQSLMPPNPQGLSAAPTP